jgi:hypothetical protein
MKRLEDINRAASAYAIKFGGIYPESLAESGPPPFHQKADCRATGLLARPLQNPKGGYIIEYQSSFPCTDSTGSCRGQKANVITARPIVFGKSGDANLYTDQTV